MRYFVLTLLGIALVLILMGAFSPLIGLSEYQNLLLGWGTCFLFFLFMPIFLWTRYAKYFNQKTEDDT